MMKLSSTFLHSRFPDSRRMMIVCMAFNKNKHLVGWRPSLVIKWPVIGGFCQAACHKTSHGFELSNLHVN